MTTKEYVDLLNERANFESAFLKEQRQLARERGVPVMLADTARFLSSIVELKKPSNILEIGMAVGYSGSLMLSHASEGARLTTMELDETSIKIAKRNFKEQGIFDRVRIFEGDAGEIVPIMSGSFDFIFLDGPKSKYIEYLPFLKKMLVKGGVLVSDNVLFRNLISGEVYRHRRMNTIVTHLRDYLDKITNDSELFTTVYDIGDGIAVSVKL